MIYFIIFISKVIENALSTLRLIVVANGKKLLGSILQFFITLVWVIITGIVLIDFKNDYFKVISFILGASVGSYIGSLIEEYIALGNNLLICLINPKLKKELTNILKNNECKLIDELQENKINILVKRKNRNKIFNLIKKIDKDAIIITEKVLFN